MKTHQYFIIVFVWITSSVSVFSQELITLEECQEKAQENYPLIKQHEWLAETEKYTLDNLAKNYLPQLSLNGQASYQSDVTQMPISLPNIKIPVMDKDQYKATLDASQLLWDGGSTRSQSYIAKANTALEKQKVEVSLYSVKERINQLYFGILILTEQLKQIELLNSDLQANYTRVNGMLKNGVAMMSDLDQVKVEMLNTEQNKIELQTLRSGYLQMLSLFINESLTESTELKIPADFLNDETEIHRPELALYQKQRLLFESRESSIKAKNRPKFSLFAQGRYGKPGLNMLESEFKLFAIGGLRLSWNFGSLYTRKNERMLIEVDKNSVDVQEQTFLFNTRVQLTQMQSEIEKYRKLMEKDQEIIHLQGRVKTAGESKYKNGVYQMSDLLRDINAENKARQTASLHKMQYLQSLYNYKYTQGN